MFKKTFKFILIKFGFIFYEKLDTLIWFLIIKLPKNLLINSLKIPFILFFKIKLPKKFVKAIEKNIINFSEKVINKKNKHSSCLSRSIASKIILNFLGIKCKLKLGMNKFINGKKVPHAWLVNAQTGLEYTSGLDLRGVDLIEI